MDGFAVLSRLGSMGRLAGSRGKRGRRSCLNCQLRLRRLQLEPLEDRALLSVGAMLGPSLPTTSMAAKAIIEPTTSFVEPTNFISSVPQQRLASVVSPATYDHIAVPVTGPVSSGGEGGISPNFVTGNMTPNQVRTAYGLNPPITIGSITGDGSGQTIAIVDAYQNTHITSDLATFDSNFGLPAPPSFSVLNQNGGTDLSGVPADSGWALEISLDVEWAHAIAPNANIVLYEANSNGTDLYTAVDTARNNPDVSVISMSWGATEDFWSQFYEPTYDARLKAPSGHIGVTFVASTGDSGAQGNYPAYSPTVLAVGGTTLDIVNSSGSYNTESGWSGSGGGTSSYEGKPTYQNALNTSTHRQIPDVALDADPSSGVMVYDAGWYNVGGTSLSAPCWAGMVAIANQFRVSAGLGTLNPPENPTQLHTLLYGFAGSPSNFNPVGFFHDVTTGGSTGSPNYPCTTGYDLCTGIGTPVANLLLPALAFGAVPGTPDLVAAYDHGSSSNDNITNLNNHDFSTELQFTVPNTASGATITLYADGTAIGSATASSSTTTVTTTGSFTLGEGDHAITARQTVSGMGQSADSTALTVTIDTIAPTVTVNQSVGQADPTVLGSTIGFTAPFSEPVLDFVSADVTLGGTAGANNVVVTHYRGDYGTYYFFVSGMTQVGTVTARVAAGVAHDVAGNANVASTSTDNTVTVVDSTRTWDGGGTDNNMTTAANWSDDVAPVAGSVLVFAGSTRTTPVNNFTAGTVFDSITFANGGFTLSGTALGLTPANGVAISNVAGQNGIDLAISAASTGTVVVQAGALRLATDAQGPVLAGSGTDIRGGKLIFDYSGGATPAATVLGLLTASYDGGAWDTGNFRSTTAVANGTTLGWKDDAASSQLTVMATIPGDFNLDGTVDSADRSLWFAGAGSGTTWAQGDANYDGAVNGLDRDILQANVSRSVSGSPLASPLASLANSPTVNVDIGVSPSSKSRIDGQSPRVAAAQTKLAGWPCPANGSDVSATNVALRTAHDAVFTGLAAADGRLDAGLLTADFGLGALGVFAAPRRAV